MADHDTPPDGDRAMFMAQMETMGMDPEAAARRWQSHLRKAVPPESAWQPQADVPARQPPRQPQAGRGEGAKADLRADRLIAELGEAIARGDQALAAVCDALDECRQAWRGLNRLYGLPEPEGHQPE